MLPTFAVHDALDAAEIIAAKLPPTLPKTAVRLYTALCAAAVEIAKRKGYSANVTHMTLHCPVEQVSRAVGISRQSSWRHLKPLRALGVLDYRTHKASCRGLVRNSGTVWMIRLNPAAGSKCRLSYDDLKHKWRDLDRDVKQGRTSYRALKHTKATPTGEINLAAITDWSLSLITNQAPVKDVCKPDLLSLLDVQSAPKQERAKAVDRAAQALATALADSRSVDFYRLIVHGALRASQRGLDVFPMLYNMATRAQVDLRESFARRAGALFVSRLKQTAFWEELRRQPPENP